MPWSLYPPLFQNGKARNEPVSSNIEAGDTGTIEFRKVKDFVFNIGIEKCKKEAF